MSGVVVKPKEAVETAEKVVDIAERIGKALDKIHALKKEGQGIRINVPERVCQYDVIVKVRSSGLISKSISFQLEGVDNVIGSCTPSLLPLKLLQGDSPHTFILPLESIPANTDYVMLQFQYKVENPNFMSNLVQTSVSAEPKEFADRDEYWMEASLKFPQILQKAYQQLTLHDMELNVDVAVDNELKTSVPQYVTKGLRNIRYLLAQTDRNLAYKALIKYLESKRQINDDVYSIVAQIDSLFYPERFKDFVDITPPFRYCNSKVGTDFYDFPGQSLPKTVTVVSRTDLNLDTPAKEGKVVYKKKNMCDELAKFF